MHLTSVSLAVITLFTGISSAAAAPQTSSGTAGTVHGTVSDPSNAAVPGATVSLENPVSHYDQTVKTDAQGTFQLVNIPFNNYHIVVTKEGFANGQLDVDVRSPIVIDVKVQLTLGTASTSVAAPPAPSNQPSSSSIARAKSSLGSSAYRGSIAAKATRCLLNSARQGSSRADLHLPSEPICADGPPLAAGDCKIEVATAGKCCP